MDLKNCLLKSGIARMLPQAIHSDSEGGGEDKLEPFIASQASQILHDDGSDSNSDDMLRDISELSMPLENLFPDFDIEIDTNESDDVGSHTEDAIVHKVEGDNNSLHQFKTEASIFAQGHNSRPAVLTEISASGKSDVNAHTTAVNGDERSSPALIPVDAQLVEYKLVNFEKSSKTNLQKKTKSTDSTSAAVGTMRKGTTKRVLKRPAKLQQEATTTTNNSRRNSAVKKVNANKPKKMCETETVNAPNRNAEKARENRRKKKQEALNLQSENTRVKKMYAELKLRNAELATQVRNEKKMNATVFGFHRIFVPSVIGLIQTVLKSIQAAAGGGGKQWEIQYPSWFPPVSESNDNIEVVLRSQGIPLDEHLLSASKYFTMHINPSERIVKIDYNSQEPNVSAHGTPL